MDTNKPLDLIQEVISKPSKQIFILIGAAVVLIIYLYGAVVSIPAGMVGVVFRKIGDDPADKDRFIVEEGEKGIQREVLMPGWRFFGKLTGCGRLTSRNPPC